MRKFFLVLVAISILFSCGTDPDQATGPQSLASADCPPEMVLTQEFGIAECVPYVSSEKAVGTDPSIVPELEKLAGKN